MFAIQSRARWLVAALAVASVLITVAPALASSHREAPFVTEHPRVDGTDFYMFRSYEEGREGFVTLIANYLPLQDAYGGPNYFSLDPSARYRINIDNDADAVEDLVFEFQFFNILNRQALNIDGTDVEVPLRFIQPVPPAAQANVAEIYAVRVLRGGQNPQLAMNRDTGSVIFSKALDYAGKKTFPDYGSYAQGEVQRIDIPGCDTTGRVFVGQRRESFQVNLGETFDLVNLNPVGDPTAERSSTADKNITSLALEVPTDCLTGGSDIIGGWTTALLPRTRELSSDPTFEQPAIESGDLVQVSRLGMPLVNEVVIGLGDKDRFNASQPSNDLANFATYVTNPTLPAILNVLFGVIPPTTPRNDLVATFVTGIDGINANGSVGEMLRLNTTIPATPAANQDFLGVIGGDNAGFPNGRRPGDDVVDIELRVAMGLLCHLGLGLCDPDDAPSGLLPYTDQSYNGPDQFDATFPYLRTPYAGSPNAYRVFNADLSGMMEVPMVDSPYTGGCGAVLNEDSTSLAISCTHNVPDVIAAHLHNAPEGSNGPIVCNFGDGASPIQFLCPLDADTLEQIRRGNTYVNIHSNTNPAGELRGQLR